MIARLELMVMVVAGVSLDSVMCAGVWGRKVEGGRDKGRVEEDGEGTYNPKSAWMLVDSRRRVLPDIDGKRSSNRFNS